MSNILNKILNLIKNKKLNDAEKLCSKLIKKNKDNYKLYNLYAIICFEKEQYEDAIKSWNKSTEINSNYYFGYNNIGKAFLRLRRYEDALQNFDKTIKIEPNFFEAFTNKGNALTRLGKTEEAIKNYNNAIQIKPDYIFAHIFKGHILSQIRRLEDALLSYENAYKINPNFPFLLGYIFDIKAKICDWEDFNEKLEKIKLDLKNDKEVIFPFGSLIFFDSPSLQLKASTIWSRRYEITTKKKIFTNKNINNDKIKIGYFTADFRNHATSHLMLGMINSHDKLKFETYGFYFGEIPKQEDSWHEKIKKNFNKFFYLYDKNDTEIASLASENKIDIAVDLMTHCSNSIQNRFGIFNIGCAPIQVNFLGYPGTSGSKYFDYIIADKTVISAENQKYFSEKIVYLPNSYQPNTKKISISLKKFVKKDFNLPDNKFIYCCFNQAQKILPNTFNIWMKILKKNTSSVIWLLEDNITAKKNLIIEAEKREVEGNRLIFCKHIKVEDHLERIKLADLFLDTFPYTAHTTCSDALRSGLPVLTMMGKSFASRVASSLLKTINLEELITQSSEEYEKMAKKLYEDTDYFNKIKEKLKKNLKNTPLYDSELYTKKIEEAYLKIFDQSQKDEIKKNIIVD